jgi:hypothetical protein
MQAEGFVYWLRGHDARQRFVLRKRRDVPVSVWAVARMRYSLASAGADDNNS